jgi:TonB family protein
MSTDELLPLLVRVLMASGAAMMLVLALRLPLRAWLGPRVAYLLWGCVPASMLALLLPAQRVVVQAVPTATLRLGDVLPLPVADAAPVAGVWLALLWLLGALLWAVMLVGRQRRFLRALGPLDRFDGRSLRAEAAVGLPAVIGLLKPRIVLPRDFAERYTPEEQRLVLAHEQVHLRRGDLWANALAALTLCLHWFNPLAHYALRRFRHDQELACDAVVIAQMPQARMTYGTAMLKSPSIALFAPMGCQWTPQHPLKERITMLKRKSLSHPRLWAARVVATGLIAAVGYAAWAQQPAVEKAAQSALLYGVDMQLQTDGQQRVFSVRQRAGEPFAIKADEGRVHWSAEFTASPVAGHADQIRIAGVIKADGKQVASPVLLTDVGKSAGIQVGAPSGGSTFKLDMTVRPLAASVAHREVTEVSDGKALAPPRYPAEALRQGQGGKVVLLVDVDAQGRPTNVQVETSEPKGVFDAAVLESARAWRFQPKIEHGKAVAGRVRVPVAFETGMQPTSAPGSAPAGDYAWYRLSPDASERVCDVLQTEPGAAADASPLCGIRKLATR